MSFFLCVVGMVMIVEGLPYFAFPDKMKLVVKKFLEMPTGSMRKLVLYLCLPDFFWFTWGRDSLIVIVHGCRLYCLRLKKN